MYSLTATYREGSGRISVSDFRHLGAKCIISIKGHWQIIRLEIEIETPERARDFHTQIAPIFKKNYGN